MIGFRKKVIRNIQLQYIQALFNNRRRVRLLTFDKHTFTGNEPFLIFF